MKTDDLITLLAADSAPRPGAGQRLVRALPAAVTLAALSLALFWGTRPDLAEALASAAVLKTLVPVALAGLAVAVALHLARPEARSGAVSVLLLLALSAIAVAFLAVLAGAEAGALGMALSKSSLWICLLSVPALSLPVLGALLWALSAGAPRSPIRGGAVAGLAAGGIGATVYSLYCDVDLPLFVLPAYGTAILVVTLLGGALGARILRW